MSMLKSIELMIAVAELFMEEFLDVSSYRRRIRAAKTQPPSFCKSRNIPWSRVKSLRVTVMAVAAKMASGIKLGIAQQIHSGDLADSGLVQSKPALIGQGYGRNMAFEQTSYHIGTQ